MSNHYERENGKMIYECDNAECFETSEFFGSFKECVVEAKQEGWRAYQANEEWLHECPLCVNKNKPTDPRQVFG